MESQRRTLERLKILRNKNEIQIVIASKKNIFLITFLSIWLIGWFLGEKNTLHEIFTKGVSGYLLFWICMWTLGGIFAFSLLVWNFAGKEIINVRSDSISIEKNVIRLGLKKNYLKEYITDVKAIKENFYIRYNEFFGLYAERVSFSYQGDSIWFAIGVNNHEADIILDIINGSINNPTKNFT